MMRPMSMFKVKGVFTFLLFLVIGVMGTSTFQAQERVKEIRIADSKAMSG